MSIKPIYYIYDFKFNWFGVLLFSPSNNKNLVKKYNICNKYYSKINTE